MLILIWLQVIGDLEEFENAVKLVIKDVTFDTDVIVSLFETNIRMLGLVATFFYHSVHYELKNKLVGYFLEVF